MPDVIQFLLAAQSTTPTPTPSATVDPNLVTPGPIGFGVMALLAVAIMLLLWDMLRRVRRAKYRIEVNEDLDAEERARRESDSGGGSAG